MIRKKDKIFIGINLNYIDETTILLKKTKFWRLLI